MPGRINGIGTTYLGRTNLGQQQGVCERCNRETVLEDYTLGYLSPDQYEADNAPALAA